MRRALRAAVLLGTLVAPAVAAAPAPPAPVTCADAGILLARNYASYDEKMLAKHETEIAKACTAAAWPQAVLDCIGSTVSESDKCITHLSHDSQVDLIASVTQATPPEAAKPAGGGDDDKFTSCEDAIAMPAAFGGGAEGGSGSDDVAWSLALRRYELVDACNDDGWPEHAKECFAKAQDEDHVLTCVKKLPDEAQTHAVSAVVAELELSRKTFEARKVAANIACPKVVAKHYGDPAWKDKLSKIKPAAKKAAIAASRTSMTKACTAEKWSPTLRACTIAGGEMPECTQTFGRDPWGYPAYGVLIPTGVASCDKYLAGLIKLAACPSAKDLRDALLGMVSSAESTLADMPDEQRKVIGEACEQGMGSLADQFKQLSCKP